MSQRALRRHHRDRLIARARRIRRRWWNSYEPDQTDWEGRERVLVSRQADHSKADAEAARSFDTLKSCSCFAYSCGNQRRCGGYQGPVLTRQERVAELELREELEELRWVE